MIKIPSIIIFLLTISLGLSQKSISQFPNSKISQSNITPAAYRTNVYVPMLKGKRIGLFANHTDISIGRETLWLSTFLYHTPKDCQYLLFLRNEFR